MVCAFHATEWSIGRACRATGRGRDSDAGRSVQTAVHRVASLPKRWLLGIHQSAVSHDQLDSDLD
jgi:hypothetical protein